MAARLSGAFGRLDFARLVRREQFSMTNKLVRAAARTKKGLAALRPALCCSNR
jgi:hypothetical protein